MHKASNGAVSRDLLSEHGTHPGTNTLLFFQCVKAVKDKRTVILPTERDPGHRVTCPVEGSWVKSDAVCRLLLVRAIGVL